MNKQQYLGEFEHAVLLSVIALNGNAYGVSLKTHMKDCIGREVSIGALHSTTERLEKKGLLTSKKTGATAARGGKAKRLFTITSSGLQALKVTKNQIEKLWESASLRYGTAL